MWTQFSDGVGCQFWCFVFLVENMVFALKKQENDFFRCSKFQQNKFKCILLLEKSRIREHQLSRPMRILISFSISIYCLQPNCVYQLGVCRGPHVFVYSFHLSHLSKTHFKHGKIIGSNKNLAKFKLCFRQVQQATIMSTAVDH